jgi:phosphoglucomutase
VLTASHNPPEYNGYKVYWNDGGQIVPPHDTAIIDQVNSLAYDEVRFDADPDLITLIGSEIDQVFIDACVANGTFDVKERQGLNIVFTSLHGTSIQSIPDALEQAGFTNVHIVEEQRIPDGDFPTVESPNPEESAALKMALDLAEETNADIVIGTDPDSDRLGIAVRDLEGKMRILNGNQTMCLMTDYLLQQWQKLGKLNGRQFVGTTIVSTDLVRDIATSYGAETKIGLTGFKWIAKMIREAEGELDFVGGGEESFGYMVGDFVRDKDAVTATLLACELAADAKQNGSSTYRELLKLYLRHSYYREHLISLVRKGMDGAEQIARMMADLRKKPFECIDGSDVVYVYDYKTSVRKDMISGNEAPISIPGSNVLIFETEDGTRVAARPSGTEPKIKFYFSVRLPVDRLEDIPHVEQALEQKIDRIIAELNLG